MIQVPKDLEGERRLSKGRNASPQPLDAALIISMYHFLVYNFTHSCRAFVAQCQIQGLVLDKGR